MLERELQKKIVQLARLYGWMVYHTYDSRRSEPGFPDLVLARDKVLFREIKTDRGRLSKAQKVWGQKLTESGADYAVWRESDWDEIVETLKK